jgi:hypothetical protein
MSRSLTKAERYPIFIGKDRWWYAGKAKCTFCREEKRPDGSVTVHLVSFPTKSLRRGLRRLATDLGKQEAARKNRKAAQ